VRQRGAGAAAVSGVLLALPSGVALAAPGPAPVPAPNPAPPQTVSPASQPAPAATQPGQPGQPGAASTPLLNEDNELILEIRTQHRELTDTITAHGLRSGIWLPLGDVARFLDLPISISDDGNYANGWYLSPSRTISINLRSGVLNQGGKEAPLPRSDFVAYNGEMWVRADRLQDMLPIRIQTDLRAQTVVVRTLEPFPFEQRAAREALRDRLASIGNHAPAPSYPRLPTPYHLIDAPIAEAELRVTGAQGVAAHVETDLRAAGDILFMTGRFYASLSSISGVVAARAELGRRDPEAHLLGPLRATEFELGDVATEAMPVGLRGVAGRGVTITNEPLEHASVFERIDFRGPLPAGFEVELYRNDTLIGSTNTPINGDYEFLQVPVDFGLNVFRLVFYGPQGERREEVRRITVGDGRLAKGAFTYNVFAVQKDRALINATPPGFQPSVDYGDWREGFSLQYGLTSAVTMVGSGALYQTSPGGVEQSRWLVSTGLRSGIAGWATKLDVSLGSGGATAIEEGLAGKVLGASVIAAHADYAHGFVDEVRSPSSLPLTSMTQFDLSRTVNLGLHSVPLALSWLHLVYADGQVTDTASFRQTVSVGRVMMANVINYIDSAAPGLPTSHTTQGTFDLSTFAGSHTQYRAEATYGLGPHPVLIGVGGEVAHDIDARTTVRASLSETFTNHQTTVGLSGTRKFGPLALSLDSTWTPNTHAFAFNLRLGFSFGRDPLSGRMFVARPGLSGSGAAAVRAFSDLNGNGQYDPGEPVLGNVSYLTGSQHVTSGASGIAVLTGTGDGTRTAIRIDGTSLPDIAMAASRPGVEVVARPGRIPVVDFAVEQLSDIEATAVYADGSRKRGVAGLILELTDAHGRRIARARSESDGFTLIEQIRPGDYLIDIAPDQARNLKIRMVGEHQLHIGPRGKTVRLKIVVAPL